MSWRDSKKQHRTGRHRRDRSSTVTWLPRAAPGTERGRLETGGRRYLLPGVSVSVWVGTLPNPAKGPKSEEQTLDGELPTLVGDFPVRREAGSSKCNTFFFTKMQGWIGSLKKPARERNLTPSFYWTSLLRVCQHRPVIPDLFFTTFDWLIAATMLRQFQQIFKKL